LDSVRLAVPPLYVGTASLAPGHCPLGKWRVGPREGRARGRTSGEWGQGDSAAVVQRGVFNGGVEWVVRPVLTGGIKGLGSKRARCHSA